MLAAAAARAVPGDPGWAPIEYLECPAKQRQVRDDLARRLGASADGVTVRTVSTSLAESSSARRRQGQPGKSSGRLAARWPCIRPVDWPTSIR